MKSWETREVLNFTDYKRDQTNADDAGRTKMVGDTDKHTQLHILQNTWASFVASIYLREKCPNGCRVGPKCR